MSSREISHQEIIVIGGGPAGMMAAIRAALCSAQVALIEKNQKLGRKLLLSGNGRSNITNLCGLENFVSRFSRHGDFLRPAFKEFFNRDLVDFFETRGVKLETEEDYRVFPATDKAASILGVLEKELLDKKVKILFASPIKEIRSQASKALAVVLISGQEISAEKIILATGGVSYPMTGSTGEGLEIAKKLGHSIVPLRAGLVPLVMKEKFLEEWEGLSFSNVGLNWFTEKKSFSSGPGALLFTRNGISGPLVLSSGGRVVDWLAEGKTARVQIDFQPGASFEKLRKIISALIDRNPNKMTGNALRKFFPERMIPRFLKQSSISPHKLAGRTTRVERERMMNHLKRFELHVATAAPIEQAMVTRGGVSLKEIDPRTMESKLVRGIYFAGEMIDIDGDTGGFNLQAAFSTGWLAGQSAAML